MPATKVNTPTPFVECLYPFLQQPQIATDSNFKDTFKITILLNGREKEQVELLKQITEFHKKAGGNQKTGERGHPVKFHATKEIDGEEIKWVQVPDVYSITFKSVAGKRDHVPTYDMENNDIWREDNYVANGSIVRISWSYEFYDTAGNKGVSLYLDAVQVKDLKEWMGKSAEEHGFNKGEGYTKNDEVEKVFDDNGGTAQEPGSDLCDQDGSPVEDTQETSASGPGENPGDDDDLPF